ncbi:hypothetical protein H311_00302 [Anncaliia algerae PRA109]|nr:hypothetical protein H311_00302 [Anncaliia algerae PRA109]
MGGEEVVVELDESKFGKRNTIAVIVCKVLGYLVVSKELQKDVAFYSSFKREMLQL